MKLNEAFPSKYLKAEDLNGRDVTVVIDGVELEEFDGDQRGGKKEKKLILSFRGKAKTLVCNKTNAGTISKVLNSQDTDDWIGKAITLCPREVEFQGEMVWAIRVSLKNPNQPKPAPTHAPSDNDGGAPIDTEETFI